MATGTILLPLLAAVPDATNPPALSFVNGRPRLAFDNTTAELIVWTFRMPADYASAPTLAVQWSGSASTTATDTVRWEGEVMKLTPNVDGAADADSYAAANGVSDDILGTTAKRIQEATMTLTNDDGVAAGDMVALRLSRNPAHADDDLGEDAWLWAVSLEYTTA